MIVFATLFISRKTGMGTFTIGRTNGARTHVINKANDTRYNRAIAGIKSLPFPDYIVSHRVDLRGETWHAGFDPFKS